MILLESAEHSMAFLLYLLLIWPTHALPCVTLPMLLYVHAPLTHNNPSRADDGRACLIASGMVASIHASVQSNHNRYYNLQWSTVPACQHLVVDAVSLMITTRNAPRALLACT